NLDALLPAIPTDIEDSAQRGGCQVTESEFEQVYTRLRTKLTCIVCPYVRGSWTDAEDAVQTAFANVFASGRWRDLAVNVADAYLVGAVKNAAVDFLRSSGTRRRYERDASRMVTPSRGRRRVAWQDDKDAPRSAAGELRDIRANEARLHLALDMA